MLRIILQCFYRKFTILFLLSGPGFLLFESDYSNNDSIRQIWMSHWRHTMVDGAELLICSHRLRILRKTSHWQLIQDSVPSTIVLRQCDIRKPWSLYYFRWQTNKNGVVKAGYILTTDPIPFIFLAVNAGNLLKSVL